MEVGREVAAAVRTNSTDVVSRRTRTLLVLVIGIGAALRLWGIRFGLPHPFARPDEEVIVNTALAVLDGDFNPHFFDWPSLFFYVTAAASALLYALQRVIGVVIPPARFLATAGVDPAVYLIARGLSAAAGIMTIVVLYSAADRLFSKRAALISAAFLSTAFLHVRDSHFGITDVPATLLIVSAFWAAVACATKGVTPARLELTGWLCGLAASTKYNAALIVLPAVVAVLRDAADKPVGLVLRGMAVLFVCTALGFLIATPYALLDHTAFTTAILDVRRHLLEGHGAMLGRGWSHHFVFTLRYGLGIPLLIAACAGACWLVMQRSWRAVLVLSFPVAYYAVLGAGLTVFARYMVPIVPFLCLTAGVFVDRVAEFAGQRFGFRRAQEITAVALVVIICVPTAARSIAFDRLLTRTDTRVLGADWIEARFPSGASIYQTGWLYGQLQPRPADRYPQYYFDEQVFRFASNGQQAHALPDIVVLVESPLAIYSPIPDRIGSTLKANYLLAMTFEGAADARPPESVYDQQDAFYVPFGGITNANRPGPNVRIFARRDP